MTRLARRAPPRSVRRARAAARRLLEHGPGRQKVTTPTPDTVIGKLPTARPEGRTRSPARPSSSRTGCGACHTFTPAGTTGKVGPEPGQSRRVGEDGEPGDARAVHASLDRRSGRLHRPGLPAGRDAAELRADAHAAAARRPRRVPGPGPLRAPGGLPARRRGRRDRPRPHPDLRTTTSCARGRSRRSRGPRRGGRAGDRLHRPDGAVGAARARARGLDRAARLLPGRGRRRRPTARGSCTCRSSSTLAREAIAAVEAEGYGLNVYVDDELYVARVTPEAERYSQFQRIPLHTVGDLGAWLDRPPTKLVVHRRPGRARRARRADARAVRRPAVGDEVAAVLPRVRRRGVSKSLGARRSSPSGSASRASGRSRSATARTTSTSSRGAGTGSRSRTPTSGSRRWRAGSARRSRRRAWPRCSRRLPRLTGMIDLRAARADPERFRAALARKGAAERFDALLAADERWRALVPRVEELRTRLKLEGQADARAARGARAG